MLKFRLKFDPDERFAGRNEIQQIVQGTVVEQKETPTTSEIKKILDDAKNLYDTQKTRENKIKKVWAAALLRDHKYGTSKYKFLKGVGLGGLFVENYKSATKIDNIG
jgi:hypothetical protein